MNFDQLKNEITKQIEQARKEGAEQARMEGYEEGWNDRNSIKMEEGCKYAWEAAFRLSKLSEEERLKIFGTTDISICIYLFSPQDVTKAINTYKEQKEKEKDELHVGDFAITDDGDPFIITCFCPDVDAIGIYGIKFDGQPIETSDCNIVKLDDHYDIEPVLERLRNYIPDCIEDLPWDD